MSWSTQPGAGGLPGVPNVRTTTESPNQQALRQGQEGLGIGLNQLASDQVGVLGDVLGTTFDPRSTAGASGFSSTGAAGGPLDLAAALGDYDVSRFDPSTLGRFQDDTEAHTRELMSRGLDRQFERGEESLRTRLANQGIEAGSQAFGDEMRAFQEGKGDAYTSAELRARDTAARDRAQMLGELQSGYDQYTGARSQQLGELLGERQQRIGESESDYGRDYAAALAERQIPLQEISSIMSGAPIQPLNPGGVRTGSVQPTDVLGAFGMNQNARNSAYQANQANAASTNQALASAAAMAAMYFWSDARLKKDLRFVGENRGVRLWDFRYVWDADNAPLHRGVLAQELLGGPYAHAVAMQPNGYFAVHYGALP